MDDIDVYISDSDFQLAAQHADAVQYRNALRSEQHAIKLSSRRRLEALRPRLEAAERRVDRLTQQYRALQYRLNIDPSTDLDREASEDDEGD